MLLTIILAALHLLALGIGLGAIWSRARVLRGELTGADIERVFLFDSLWGGAALLWISTGLVRALTTIEKGPAYYFQNQAFLVKMGLLVLVLLLEILPMVSLIRWRIRLRSGKPLDMGSARLLAGISNIQLLLVVAMVFAAVTMARGVG